MGERQRAGLCRLAGAAALVLAGTVSGCGSDGGSGPTGLGDHDEKRPVKAAESATVSLGHGDKLRISVRSKHDVVEQHYDGGAERWTAPRRLADVSDRECGDVDASAAHGTVAATLDCDQDYSEDEAPTDSLAVVSEDLVHWSQHDLSGEAYGVPGVSPNGRHAIWSQQTGVLLFSTDGEWAARRANGTDGVPVSDDGVTVTDDGGPVTAAVRNCDIQITGPVAGRVPISHPGRHEAGHCSFAVDEMRFDTPDLLHVSVDGAAAGTRLVIGREGDRWRLVSAENG